MRLSMPSNCVMRRGALAIFRRVVVAGNVARDLDIAFGRQRRQQVELLKHETDLAAAKPGAAGVGHGGEVDAVDEHVAGVGVREAAENIEERRLAAARRPDDGDELALLDCQRDAAQRLHIDFTDAVSLADVLCLDHPPHANLR